MALEVKEGDGAEAAPRRTNTSVTLSRTVEIEDDMDETPWHSDEVREVDHCGSQFVLYEENPLRQFWSFLITLLLAYTGTIFLYRLCFISFSIDPPADFFEGMAPRVEQLENDGTEEAWLMFDSFVAVIFWIDLVATFFFTYEGTHGEQVDSLRQIAVHYLCGAFIINFVACIPERAVDALLQMFSPSDGSSNARLNQGLRALRLQRMSRLARLIRLTRLARVSVLTNSSGWRWLERQKGIRVINLVFGLMWIVHILACGWYLCAALHHVPEDTWVAKRWVDGSDEVNLLYCTPVIQWMNSMYFVLTVFTTVGFGDISAYTIGEIVYVCFTMVVGVIVHSMIISEVITVVTTADQTNVFVAKQVELIEAFSRHTELSIEAQRDMKHWISVSARFWVTHKYDRDVMRELITGKYMPRNLLGRLPCALYDGKLVHNRMLRVCRGICNVPPRLPMLLALASHKSVFKGGEVIYQAQDYPFNIFLVLAGTFAFVATPSREGGVCATEKIQDPPKDYVPQERPERSRSNLPGFFKSGSKVSSDSAAAEVIAEEANGGGNVFPYQLFSFGSYFGEAELLAGSSRKATARCESETGSLLAIHKTDFSQLASEFPQFGRRWRSAAVANERTRMRRMSALTRGLNYKNFAAASLQRWFRAWGGSSKTQPSHKRVDLELMGQRKIINDMPSTNFNEKERVNRDIAALRKGMKAMDEKMDQVLLALKLITDGQGGTVSTPGSSIML